MAQRRALIVDDEVIFALNMEADMQELGFDVCDLAANGHQATTLAMSNQPDVVLMDVNLEGGREGIEVARWLHELCDVPIVFVTGCLDPDTLARINKQVPGARVLTKPVFRDRLADAVAAVSPKSSLNRASWQPPIASLRGASKSTPASSSSSRYCKPARFTPAKTQARAGSIRPPIRSNAPKPGSPSWRIF